MPFNPPPHSQILLQALTDPNRLAQYSDPEWELLIRMARRVKLLGRLALLVKKHGLWEKTPPRIATQLISGLAQIEKLQQLCNWELDRILWALDDFDTTVIALKGMAYRLIQLPYAEGRLSVDLDLLVPKKDLTDIESILMVKGWKHHSMSAYDERYYRVWSHEIPPLVHAERETEVDIHHTLAPLTSRVKIDADLLFANATTIQEKEIKLLSPVDMAIHCAVNLFQNNEIANDLRDLLDFHDLTLYFNQQETDFWTQLIDRTNQLKLAHPVFYSLYFSQLIFKTPIPTDALGHLHSKPGAIKLAIMQRLVPLALFPQHPDKPSSSASLARLWLYLRSHFIRMPLYILLPHLIYKTIRIIPWRRNKKASQR